MACRVALFIVVAVWAYKTALTSPVLLCPSGTGYFGGVNGEPGGCEPCPDGTYNDESSVGQAYCEPCTLHNEHDVYKIVVKNCTKEHDTIFQCVKGLCPVPDHPEADCAKCPEVDKSSSRFTTADVVAVAFTAFVIVVAIVAFGYFLYKRTQKRGYVNTTSPARQYPEAVTFYKNTSDEEEEEEADV